VSFCTDDSIAVFYPATDVTIQDSLIAYGLSGSSRCPACSAKGLLVGKGGTRVSVLRTLNANNFYRFPQTTDGDIDFVNNVDFNSAGQSAQISGFYAPMHINFTGNTYKDGIDTDAFVPTLAGAWAGFLQQWPSIHSAGSFSYTSTSGIFAQDNIGRYDDGICKPKCPFGQSGPDTRIIWSDDGGNPIQTTRYAYPLMTTVTAAQAYDLVLNNSGAQPRDSLDTLVVNGVRNGTGRWINEPSQVGGWPVLSAGTP
jgi:hypothetical protein